MSGPHTYSFLKVREQLMRGFAMRAPRQKKPKKPKNLTLFQGWGALIPIHIAIPYFHPTQKIQANAWTSVL